MTFVDDLKAAMRADEKDPAGTPRLDRLHDHYRLNVRSAAARLERLNERLAAIAIMRDSVRQKKADATEDAAKAAGLALLIASIENDKGE